MADGKILLPAGQTLAYDRNASGYVLIDGVESAATRQCGHCSNHFLCVKGSGITRGFCTKCGSWLCGRAGCISGCYEFQRKIEDYEKGKLGILR